MALMKRSPNTIWLGGQIERMDEHIAGVAITPGDECEFYDDGGTMKLRPLASATQQATRIIAEEDLFHNKTIDDVYAVGNLVRVAKFLPGSSFWGRVPSGQNLAAGVNMQPNGNGMHKAATSSAAGDNLAAYQSIESTGGAVAVTTRLRIHVL
jgi:hypothetical protein